MKLLWSELSAWFLADSIFVLPKIASKWRHLKESLKDFQKSVFLYPNFLILK